MTQGLYLGWLAVHEDQIIGGAGLLLLHWGPGRYDSSPLRGRVVNVYVEPEFRRQGIARRLLERVLEAAQERKIQTLSLGSSAEARGLYALLGFQSSQTEMWLRLPYSEA
jgi:GNAT superfamily N-acetyltransferase